MLPLHIMMLQLYILIFIIAYKRYTNLYNSKLTLRKLWRSIYMNNISFDLIHILLHYVLHVMLLPQNIKKTFQISVLPEDTVLFCITCFEQINIPLTELFCYHVNNSIIHQTSTLFKVKLEPIQSRWYISFQIKCNYLCKLYIHVHVWANA